MIRNLKVGDDLKDLEDLGSSKLFTVGQVDIMGDRLKGDYRDSSGNFSLRVAPKLREILFFWLPRRRLLISLLKRRGRK